MSVAMRDEVKALMSDIVTWRRYLHKHAELSFEEFETSNYIESQLKAIGGITISRPLPTGVVAVIEGAHPGKTVALRADIDALPMQEDNDLDFASVNHGVMHSCGHDGHAAMLLGVAKLFAAKKEQMHGKLVCIFQHAEELPPGGAIELVKAGVMEGVDEIFGMHLSSSFPTGKFGIKSGVLTSATDGFGIKVIGRGGHSSMPEQCIDPVTIGAQIIMALQNIKSRMIPASETLAFSVCKVHCGDAYNIIPGEMMIEGSIRSFNQELRERLPKIIEQIASGIASSYGATVECTYDWGYGSVINDEALTDKAREVLTEWFDKDHLLEIGLLMPGEDFSAFTGETGIPGCFVEIGTANEEKGTKVNHHNPKYMMDEDGLFYGTSFFAGMVERELEVY